MIIWTKIKCAHHRHSFNELNICEFDRLLKIWNLKKTFYFFFFDGTKYFFLKMSRFSSINIKWISICLFIKKKTILKHHESKFDIIEDKSRRCRRCCHSHSVSLRFPSANSYDCLLLMLLLFIEIVHTHFPCVK